MKYGVPVRAIVCAGVVRAMRRHVVSLVLVTLTSWAQAAEHRVELGESPQAALDRAAAGDKLVFLPGLHQHRLGKHRALLYVDKPVEIELQQGATLKLADGETQLEAEPEITTDQDAAKKLDDLAMGGQFDRSRPASYTLRIDGVGQEGQPDTCAWGVFHTVANPQGTTNRARSESNFSEPPFTTLAITGEWQELNHGVKVRFGSPTGHSQGSLWFVSYDGPEA
jgi:hypothetical protein